MKAFQELMTASQEIMWVRNSRGLLRSLPRELLQELFQKLLHKLLQLLI